jgi:hypothetical protein
MRIDLDVSLGFGISDVDSVRVAICGTSHTGYSYHGGDWPCWDGVLISFVDDVAAPGSCLLRFDETEYEGQIPCVGAMVAPVGDGIAYCDTVTISQIQPQEDGVPIQRTVASVTTWGEFLADGVSVLRLWRIDGAAIPRCYGGVPDVDEVVLTIYYDLRLPTSQTSWGSLKSSYR